MRLLPQYAAIMVKLHHSLSRTTLNCTNIPYRLWRDYTYVNPYASGVAVPLCPVKCLSAPFR